MRARLAIVVSGEGAEGSADPPKDRAAAQLRCPPPGLELDGGRRRRGSMVKGELRGSQGKGFEGKI